ncbi:hypothetical protein [Thiomicrospira sp. WB1]|uniref:hypothetical protein n=1 Tax=Thiomicrospira sp. WB1 TaxID=1685380 RepID=UPI00074939B4|nr:hypothetical protein [Thiomicrospira sp. WB1]KUJ72407.1 hypothetical protein AVO41_00905 [Thiomicrospira sp. WB1]
MPLWFEKGESRRFQRIDLPLKLYITPKNPIRHMDIMALGIDYFPPIVKKQLNQYQRDVEKWLPQVQEHQADMQTVFKQLMQSADFFARWTDELAKGRAPNRDKDSWLRLHAYAKGVAHLLTPLKATPKTCQYLTMIDDKLMQYYQHFKQIIEHSTHAQFHCDRLLTQQNFDIDTVMAAFESDKYARSPLVQSLLHLYRYIETVLNAYDELNLDMHSRQNPKVWATQTANISAGGVAVFRPKRFAQGEKHLANLYFAEQKKLVQLPAYLARSFSIQQKHTECNAFNFDFPSGQDQHLIQHEIERFEILDSMNVALT